MTFVASHLNHRQILFFFLMESGSCKPLLEMKQPIHDEPVSMDPAPNVCKGL